MTTFPAALLLGRLLVPSRRAVRVVASWCPPGAHPFRPSESDASVDRAGAAPVVVRVRHLGVVRVTHRLIVHVPQRISDGGAHVGLA